MTGHEARASRPAPPPFAGVVVALVFHLIYQRDIQSGMLLVFQNDSAR
jgi:hypothetical protein